VISKHLCRSERAFRHRALTLGIKLPSLRKFGPVPSGRALAEGEGEIDGLAFVDRIAALANDRGSYFDSNGLPGSCIYPEQGSCD
jgi:hypothetical protein